MSSKEVTERMLGNEKNMNRFTLCNYLMRKLFKSARLSTNVSVTYQSWMQASVKTRSLLWNNQCFHFISSNNKFITLLWSNNVSKDSRA